MESVGFKEWSAVCEALERGRQSILLRKGGIAEGRDRFSFKHEKFFLFPTWFHEQSEKVRDKTIELRQTDPGKIEIRLWAKLELSRTVVSRVVAERLEHLHVLQPEVVRERFEYDQAPGLHVAFLRVFRVVPSWTFPNEKRYGGCRSWVNLPDPPTNIAFEPVLSEAELEKERRQFLEIVGEKAG
ncbi:MAG: hypothetical protein QOG67_1965 [Verrucomicrobiota bacterium]|jgi:hypothetical protein